MQPIQLDDVYALLGPEEELHRYAPAFEYHQIGADIFGDLTHEDLKDIGVESLGHRIKIMRQVRSFKQSTASSTTSATAPKESSSINASSQSSAIDPSQGSKEVLKDMVNRIDYYESLVKRANDQIAIMRMDINKRVKNSDPLPEPGVRRVSTPSIASSTSTLKASTSTASFVNAPGTPGTSLASMHQNERHNNERHNERHGERHSERHGERYYSERQSEPAPNINSSGTSQSVRRVPYRQAHSIVIPSEATDYSSDYFPSTSAPTSAMPSSLNEYRRDDKRGSILINNDRHLSDGFQSPAVSSSRSSSHSSIRSPALSSSQSSKRSSVQSPAQSPGYEDAVEPVSSNSTMANAF